MMLAMSLLSSIAQNWLGQCLRAFALQRRLKY
jgi:hypothetical protein